MDESVICENNCMVISSKRVAVLIERVLMLCCYSYWQNHGTNFLNITILSRPYKLSAKSQ